MGQADMEFPAQSTRALIAAHTEEPTGLQTYWSSQGLKWHGGRRLGQGVLELIWGPHCFRASLEPTIKIEPTLTQDEIQPTVATGAWTDLEPTKD